MLMQIEHCCIPGPPLRVIVHFIPVALYPSPESRVIVMFLEPVEGFGSQDTPLLVRRALLLSRTL